MLKNSDKTAIITVGRWSESMFAVNYLTTPTIKLHHNRIHTTDWQTIYCIMWQQLYASQHNNCICLVYFMAQTHRRTDMITRSRQTLQHYLSRVCMYNQNTSVTLIRGLKMYELHEATLPKRAWWCVLWQCQTSYIMTCVKSWKEACRPETGLSP